jgi:hypothetical protein
LPEITILMAAYGLRAEISAAVASVFQPHPARSGYRGLYC